MSGIIYCFTHWRDCSCSLWRAFTWLLFFIKQKGRIAVDGRLEKGVNKAQLDVVSSEMEHDNNSKRKSLLSVNLIYERLCAENQLLFANGWLGERTMFEPKSIIKTFPQAEAYNQNQGQSSRTFAQAKLELLCCYCLFV